MKTEIYFTILLNSNEESLDINSEQIQSAFDRSIAKVGQTACVEISGNSKHSYWHGGAGSGEKAVLIVRGFGEVREESELEEVARELIGSGDWYSWPTKGQIDDAWTAFEQVKDEYEWHCAYEFKYRPEYIQKVNT